MERFVASMRKACAVIKLSRVVFLYKSNARDNSALVMQMKEITQTRVHYGYRRVHVMLRREGFIDNHKRVYRLYREQGQDQSAHATLRTWRSKLTATTYYNNELALRLRVLYCCLGRSHAKARCSRGRLQFC